MNNELYPIISVIIRTYNREELISRALRSALNQTYSNIEIIVVNDGSTDNTLVKLKSFDSQKVKIFSHETNLGLVAALNTGFEKVSDRTFAISFLDSDDTWAPEHLSVLINKLNSNRELGFVYSQTRGRRAITIEGCELYGVILKNKALTPLCSLLIKKDLADKVFPIISKFEVCEDDRICYELSKRSCFSFVVHPTFIPIGASNSITRNRKKLALGWGGLLEDYAQDIEKFAGLSALLDRRIDQLFLWLLAGEFKNAHKEFEIIWRIRTSRLELLIGIFLKIPLFLKNCFVFYLNYLFPYFVNYLRRYLRNK